MIVLFKISMVIYRIWSNKIIGLIKIGLRNFSKKVKQMDKIKRIQEILNKTLSKSHNLDKREFLSLI